MVKPLEWMRAVRDAVPRFSTARLAVLYSLALRMGRDGTGFGSARQLAQDAATDERTVRRATSTAIERGYLKQTRRGHRLGSGQTVASEWVLTRPQQDTGDRLSEDTGVRLSESQQDTGDRLTAGLNRTGDGLNRTQGHSQPDTGDRPRGLPPEVSTFQSSALARGQRSARSRRTIAEATANRTIALAAKAVMEHTGEDREYAKGFIRWLIANRPDVRHPARFILDLVDKGTLDGFIGANYARDTQGPV